MLQDRGFLLTESIKEPLGSNVRKKLTLRKRVTMARKKKDKETQGAMDFASFMAQANKDETIINLSDREDKFYRFGDYNLDRALGGGIPEGSILALQGAPSSGKSIAALTLARQVINQDDENARVAYFDIENKISSKAIRMMGLERDDGKFLHLTMGNLEDVLEQLVKFSESGFFQMLVVDSLDALTTDEQEERDIHEGSKVGGYKAKVLSENLPSVVRASAMNNCTIVFVQQIRKDPGAMFGNPMTTSGGEAIKHAVTVRLNFSPNAKGNVEENGKITYQGANVRILKTNQGSVPKDPIQIRFYIGDEHEWGIDGVNSLLDEAIRLRIIPPKNPTSHIYIGCDELCSRMGVKSGELSFNGKNNLLKAVSTDEEFQKTLKDMVSEANEGTWANPFSDSDDEEIEDFENLES